MGRFSVGGWVLGDEVSDNGRATYIPSVKLVDATGTASTFLAGVAQGSTTSGQTGVLSQGAVTTAAPAYTTAQTSPFSLTLTGDLRTQAQGVDASGATITARPVLISGYASNSFPTATTAGKAISPWLSLNGATVVSFGTTGAITGTAATGGYIVDNAGSARPLFTYSMYSDNATGRVAIGDANAAAAQPSLTTLFWNYAAANLGIVNTVTAVTIKAAGGASVRNYIEALQVDWELLGSATEIAIRDGAAGTVLWRTKIGTAAGSRTFNFRPALKGTANTLMEFVTLTASITGAVYVNAQGWTGS